MIPYDFNLNVSLTMINKKLPALQNVWTSGLVHEVILNMSIRLITCLLMEDFLQWIQVINQTERARACVCVCVNVLH